MNRLDAEVLVVGGGPAGAATAALLARRGHDVLLLEKAAFPREKPCAEYLSPGVIDVLARLGVLDEVRAAEAAWPLGMRVDTGRASFLVSYAASAANGGGHRTALGIRRPIFDAVLLNHARRSGTRVREHVLTLGAIVERGRVVGVRARGPAGEERLRSRFVVAADGLHSTIARSLDLNQPVRWPRRLGLVARYAEVRGIGEFGEMHVGPGLYCGLAPVGAGLVNVGLVVPLNGKATAERVEHYFERRLAELPGVGRALSDARRVTAIRGVGPLARRVRRAAGPGYLLVGDAAGFLDPFTGEGVYRALRGAELAAAVVEQALQHDDGEPVEPGPGYEHARRVAFADKERLCLLVQLFLSSQRLFHYVVGRLAARPDLAALLSAVLGDYQPAASALAPRYLWSLLRP